VRDRPGLAGYVFGLADEEVSATRNPLNDLPLTATFTVSLENLPQTMRPLQAQVILRMAEPAAVQWSARSSFRWCQKIR
jgi:alpha-2-macroglobulin